MKLMVNNFCLIDSFLLSYLMAVDGFLVINEINRLSITLLSCRDDCKDCLTGVFQTD